MLRRHSFYACLETYGARPKDMHKLLEWCIKIFTIVLFDMRVAAMLLIKSELFSVLHAHEPIHLTHPEISSAKSELISSCFLYSAVHTCSISCFRLCETKGGSPQKNSYNMQPNDHRSEA